MRLKAPHFIIAAALSRDKGASCLSAKPATLDTTYLPQGILPKASYLKLYHPIFVFQLASLLLPEETVALCAFVHYNRGFKSSGV